MDPEWSLFLRRKFRGYQSVLLAIPVDSNALHGMLSIQTSKQHVHGWRLDISLCKTDLMRHKKYSHYITESCFGARLWCQVLKSMGDILEKCPQRIKEHTSERRLTDFSPQMIDSDSNIMTKHGKSDQILPMRLQLHCKQEPFLIEIEG